MRAAVVAAPSSTLTDDLLQIVRTHRISVNNESFSAPVPRLHRGPLPWPLGSLLRAGRRAGGCLLRGPGPGQRLRGRRAADPARRRQRGADPRHPRRRARLQPRRPGPVGPRLDDPDGRGPGHRLVGAHQLLQPGGLRRPLCPRSAHHHLGPARFPRRPVGHELRLAADRPPRRGPARRHRRPATAPPSRPCSMTKKGCPESNFRPNSGKPSPPRPGCSPRHEAPCPRCAVGRFVDHAHPEEIPWSDEAQAPFAPRVRRPGRPPPRLLHRLQRTPRLLGAGPAHRRPLCRRTRHDPPAAPHPRYPRRHPPPRAAGDLLRGHHLPRQRRGRGGLGRGGHGGRGRGGRGRGRGRAAGSAGASAGKGGAAGITGLGGAGGFLGGGLGGLAGSSGEPLPTGYLDASFTAPKAEGTRRLRPPSCAPRARMIGPRAVRGDQED